MSPSDTLVGYCGDLNLEDIPEHVRDHARLSLLNAVGVTLGGLASDAARIAIRQSEFLGGSPQAHVFGTDHVTSVDRAGLVNGIAAHVLDFDDTHLPTVYHPTAPLMASVVPMAESLDATGAEFLQAWIVGLEAGLRVANALGRAHYDLGWHITSTAGYLAAALGCARLLGLDFERTRHALGIAATQSSGHRQQFGAMTKSLHAGVAGSGGILAALLAQHNYTADHDSVHGRRGFLAVMSSDPHPTALSEGLGEEWILLQNCLKPYASGVVTHPLIDAGRQLRGSGLAVDMIEDIHLSVHPLVVELTNIEEPVNGLESKFSVRHCFAVGFLDDAAGPEQFSDDRARAADVIDVRNKITVEDGGHPPMQTRVTVRTRSGSTLEIDIVDARGTLQRPLTREEVIEKYKSLAEPVLGPEGARRTLEVIAGIHDRRFSELIEAASPRPA